MEFHDLYNFAQAVISQREVDGKTSAIVPVVDLKKELVGKVEWLLDINFHPVDRQPDDPLGHYECHSDTDSRWEEPDAWLALITYGRDLNTCE